MARQWFKATKLRAEGKSTATLSAKGLLSFNRTAIDDFGLNNFKYAEIGYEDEIKAILVKFLTEKTEGSALLSIGKTTKVKGESKATVSASIKSQLNQMKINLDSSMRYDFCKDDQDSENCFCIMLETGVVVQRETKAKSKK